MTEHYVTLFDSLFLPQGLALHASMERHAGAYTLWVLCMDQPTHDFLNRLALPNVRLLDLAQLETEALRAVRPTRSIGEYCWTLTPFAPRFVFEADSRVDRVTYLDADIWFRRSPARIFRELEASGKAVLITDHAYAAEYDQSATGGQYCVQFLTLTRAGGDPVRKSWEAQCLDWCHARIEDGKFGDQKYLDDWPETFPDAVHVLADKELALAPWNAMRFPYGHSVFWHFHGLRILAGHRNTLRVALSDYPLPPVVQKYVYAPYLDDLRQAVRLMRENGIPVRPQRRRKLADALRAELIAIYRRLWQFNVNLMARL